MFKRRGVRRLAIILGVFLVIMIPVIIVNTANGVYGNSSTIANRDVLVGQRLGKLATHVRAMPGVAAVKTVYLPLHDPEPADTLAIVMKHGATSDEYASALIEAEANSSKYSLPATTRTAQIYDGLSVVTLNGIGASPASVRVGVATWFALSRSDQTPVQLSMLNLAGFTRAALWFGGSSTTASLARLADNTAVLANSGSSAAPMLWTLSGSMRLTSSPALPPATALAQALAAQKTAGTSAQLRWNGAVPSQSNLCFIGSATAGYAAADVAAAAFLAAAHPVTTFCFGPQNSVAAYRFTVGNCTGTIVATAADKTYLAHLRSAGGSVPRNVVAGTCAAAN